LAGEGGWGRLGPLAAAPEISFLARSGRQELHRPLPSPPRPARGGSRAPSALTSADPATHLHLPSSPRQDRGEDTVARSHTCRKMKMTYLLKGAVALFTTSYSGHQSSRRARRNPSFQISPLYRQTAEEPKPSRNYSGVPPPPPASYSGEKGLGGTTSPVHDSQSSGGRKGKVELHRPACSSCGCGR
jgi:hypothetical protein